jgi:signal transduction histidine kinase
VGGVIGRFGPAVAEAQVTVIGPPPERGNGDPPNARLWVDPGALERALINVVEHAVKFSPKGGRVVVSLKDKGPSLQIMVVDEGPGIPAEKINGIWDLFGRRGSGPAGGRQGASLGLAIARGLVAAHGGRLTVRSQEGRGSRDTIHLPVRRLRRAAVLARERAAGAAAR